jgi:hypothetical protein
MVSADPRPLMASVGSSRVRLVDSEGYFPFLEESSWTGSGQDPTAGWVVRGT